MKIFCYVSADTCIKMLIHVYKNANTRLVKRTVFKSKRKYRANIEISHSVIPKRQARPYLLKVVYLMKNSRQVMEFKYILLRPKSQRIDP